MAVYNQKSRCCSGTPVTFRWFGYPTAAIGKDLEVATTKFIQSIFTPNRTVNEYIASMAAAEFRKIIKIAESGKLKPERQVKAVDINNPPPLFEFRWQGITVREKGVDDRLSDRRLLVRMYTSEPSAAPDHFIGHHIHEKIISGDPETWLLQNGEIATAVGFYRAGESTNWGLGT